MSLKTNAVVFGTFFINCIIIGLLVAAFVTEHWVVATAKRHDNTKSHGDLNFGLFQGSKQMNAGVGVRTENIDGRRLDTILHVPRRLLSKLDHFDLCPLIYFIAY